MRRLIIANVIWCGSALAETAKVDEFAATMIGTYLANQNLNANPNLTLTGTKTI